MIKQPSADSPFMFGNTEEATDKNGITYTITEAMNKYDWTLKEFLEVYSQVSGENKDTIMSSGVVDADTMQKLHIYFVNNYSKAT